MPDPGYGTRKPQAPGRGSIRADHVKLQTLYYTKRLAKKRIGCYNVAATRGVAQTGRAHGSGP